MPSDVFEPPVEPPRPGDPGPTPPPDGPEAVSADPPPPFPAVPASSTSGDDLTLSLTQARPDPLLGAFVTPPPLGEAEFPPEPPAEPSGPEPTTGAGDHDALAHLVPGADAPAPAPAPTGSTSFDALKGLDLQPPAPAKAPPEQDVEHEDDEDEPIDDEDDEEPAARGPSLGVMLVASYASALTLGVAWLLWTGRHVRPAAEPDQPVAADNAPDPGLRAGNAHRIVVKPIAADHTAGLGKTIRLGQIEVTPLEVTSGPVVLERHFERRETKKGGEKALKLRLRLRNVSADTVLAPLDEAFLRDRPRADPDSFIETKPGARPIPLFPLAVESEWSIVGQEFRELRPGETLETQVVSAPDALAQSAPANTWRVRLRTDVNHTDDLGVPFRDSDIKTGR